MQIFFWSVLKYNKYTYEFRLGSFLRPFIKGNFPSYNFLPKCVIRKKFQAVIVQLDKYFLFKQSTVYKACIIIWQGEPRQSPFYSLLPGINLRVVNSIQKYVIINIKRRIMFLQCQVFPQVYSYINILLLSTYINILL